MENILQIDSVLKKFGDKTILSDIFLEVKTNEIVGIVGRNGCGKSTFLKILFGIESAQNCFIRYNNQPIKKPYKINDLIAYSSQKNIFPKNTTPKKIIELSTFEDVTVDFDIFFKKILHTKIDDLSGGEKKLLQTFIVLNSKAKFILLDEPFSGLSPLMIEELKNVIIEKSKTKGIIICDHLYHEILDLSSKIYLLKNTAIKQIKSIDDLSFHGYI